MTKYILKNVNVFDSNKQCFQEKDIVIKDGLIDAVGENIEAQGAIQLLSGNHYCVLPGFVNAHTHIAMTLLRDYGGDKPLHEWLNNFIWPAEAKMTDKDVYWGTQLGLLEMIATGTTCYVEMYDHLDAIAQATSESGMRAVLSRGSVGLFDQTMKSLDDNDDVYKNWHQKANGRLRVWYAPHAPNTCSGEYIQEFANHARERNTGIHIHVAETKDEMTFVAERYHMTPFTWLESLDVLDVPTLMAHCVWASESDMDICKKYNVAIAHNPVSNLKLGSGIAPVEEMIKKGIIVGLGTDGASSNNSLNMHREMQTAALLHKVRNLDAQAIGAKEALNMATLGGARAIRWDDEIGSIDVGKQADLVVYKLDQPWHYPKTDILNNLVYSSQSSDIYKVFIQGKCVYSNGEYLTLDKERILYETEKRAKNILR